jgi:hypothetical protein
MNCLLVLTRDYPHTGAASGRERMVAQMRAALRGHCQMREFRLRSLSETRNAWSFLRALLHLLQSLLVLRPLPVQVLLFFDAARINELVARVRREQPDAIYFDGIRSLEYLVAVKRAIPHVRAVCDLDDLMSRRMALLHEARLGISAGYLSAQIPGWIQRHILRGVPGQLLTRYEQSALRRAELAALEAADAVTLLSSEDASCLSGAAREALRTKITAIPPATLIRRPMQYPQLPLRFVFLGSDVLTQNRLTIEWLLRLWREKAPMTPLHIYGRMQHSYDVPDNVYMEGFVESIDNVYTANSILLAPSFLGGGIKTKVLEAIANGVIVLGNDTSFEGLGFEVGGLALTDEALERIVTAPQGSLDHLYAAAVAAQNLCRARLDPAVVHVKWMQLMAIQQVV